jgi:hypothetical protein
MDINYFKMLRTSLNNLALPMNLQLKWNGTIGCVTCELFEDYDHCFLMFERGNSSFLSEDQNKGIKALHDFLENMDGRNFECFDESMLEHPEWETVRMMSKQVLKLFNWDIVYDFEIFDDGQMVKNDWLEVENFENLLSKKTNS